MEPRASFSPPSPAHVLDFAPLRRLVAEAFPDHPADKVEPVAMPGGASSRSYYRVPLLRGGSAVAMFVPHGDAPEEVQKPATNGRWPFLEVAELLRERGVDVPRILGESTSDGWVLLEDLGEDTLARYLGRSPEARESLYQRAVLDLARAQRALAVLPSGSVVASRSFDEELLTWELEHFREWALEARGVAISPDERETWGRAVSFVAREVAALPRSFVHRDFQSRNLMVRADGGLCWLDFQDALIGPFVYDLVALLNDSYQVFERPFVEKRLDEFAAAAGIAGEGRASLGRAFDLVTVQRKLKDAGRFVFIDRVRKNPSFLPFVEPTIQKAVDALARIRHSAPELEALLPLVRRALS